MAVARLGSTVENVIDRNREMRRTRCVSIGSGEEKNAWIRSMEMCVL